MRRKVIVVSIFALVVAPAAYFGSYLALRSYSSERLPEGVWITVEYPGFTRFHAMDDGTRLEAKSLVKGHRSITGEQPAAGEGWFGVGERRWLRCYYWAERLEISMRARSRDDR